MQKLGVQLGKAASVLSFSIVVLLIVLVSVACGPGEEEQAETIQAQAALAVHGTMESIPTFTAAPTLTPYPTHTQAPTLTPRPTYTSYPTYTPLPTLSPHPTYTPLPTDIPTPTPTSTSTPAPASAGAPAASQSMTISAFDTRTIMRISAFMQSIYDIFRGEILVAPWGETIIFDPTIDCLELVSTYERYRSFIPPEPSSDVELRAYTVFLHGIEIFEEPVIGWVEKCRINPIPRKTPGPVYNHVYVTTQEAVGFLSEAIRILEEG